MRIKTGLAVAACVSGASFFCLGVTLLGDEHSRCERRGGALATALPKQRGPASGVSATTRTVDRTGAAPSRADAGDPTAGLEVERAELPASSPEARVTSAPVEPTRDDAGRGLDAPAVGDEDEVVRLLRRLREASLGGLGESTLLWAALAELSLRVGDATTAAYCLGRALQADPDGRAWAASLRVEGPPDVRAAALERLLRGRQPVPGPFAVALVDAYNDAGRAADAARACREALAHDPTSAGLAERLVELDRATAIVHLERVVPGLPRQESSASLWGLLGDAYLAAGRRAEARLAYGRAHELRPDADWLDAMASLDLPGTLPLLEAQARAQPDDAYAWGQLAAAYLEVGRRGDALSCYQRAAALDAEDEEWRRMAAALSQAR